MLDFLMVRGRLAPDLFACIASAARGGPRRPRCGRHPAALAIRWHGFWAANFGGRFDLTTLAAPPASTASHRDHRVLIYLVLVDVQHRRAQPT
jgi:hypothetical protein